MIGYYGGLGVINKSVPLRKINPTGIYLPHVSTGMGGPELVLERRETRYRALRDHRHSVHVRRLNLTLSPPVDPEAASRDPIHDVHDYYVVLAYLAIRLLRVMKMADFERMTRCECARCVPAGSVRETVC